jgi:hypothetical protein
MAKRPIIEDPYKRMPKAPSGVIDGGERDVMGYAPPSRVAVNDAKSPGLHGKNFDYCGSQGKSSLDSQSSGSPGLGGDGIRLAGSQGRR